MVQTINIGPCACCGGSSSLGGGTAASASSAFYIWLWFANGDTLTTLQWSISSGALESGTIYQSGSGVPTSTTFIENNNVSPGVGYDIYKVYYNALTALPTGVQLWLNVYNANTLSGTQLCFWDQSSGPSNAQQNNGQGVIPSESFQILGGSNVLYDNVNGSAFNVNAYTITSIGAYMVSDSFQL